MNLKKNKSYIVPFDIWSAMDLRGLVSTDDYIWMPYPPDVTAKELAAFSDRWAGAHSILENCSRPREVDPIGSEFDLIHEIVNDYYSYNLIDRSIKSIKFLFSDNQKVMFDVARYFMSEIKRYGIEEIISFSTPHQWESYLLMRVAKRLGVKFRIIERSAIAHRYWITSNYSPLRKLSADKFDPNNISERTASLIKQLRGDLESPLNFVQFQQEVYGANQYNISSEVKKGIYNFLHARFFKLIMQFIKYKLHKQYLKYSKKLGDKDRFEKVVTFFLSYQPEKTTLPEAGIFFHQELLIRTLAHAVPEGCEVLVREHPSTFLMEYEVGGRRLDFYQRISEIRNVRLDDMSRGVNEVIDSSDVVATCTGKVGFQAVLRGVPCLTFGSSQYNDMPYVSAYSNYESLVKNLHKYINCPPQMDEREIMKYLAAVEHFSVEEQPIINISSRRKQRIEAMIATLLDSEKRGFSSAL